MQITANTSHQNQDRVTRDRHKNKRIAFNSVHIWCRLLLFSILFLDFHGIAKAICQKTNETVLFFFLASFCNLFTYRWGLWCVFVCMQHGIFSIIATNNKIICSAKAIIRFGNRRPATCIQRLVFELDFDVYPMFFRCCCCSCAYIYIIRVDFLAYSWF